MKRLGLTSLDWINLFLVLLGFGLLIGGMPFPRVIFLISSEGIPKVPPIIPLVIGSMGEVLSLVTRSRTIKILALLLLIFTVVPAFVNAAIAPRVAIHVVANSREMKSRVTGEIHLSCLDNLEVVYEAKRGTRYMYASLISNDPIGCPDNMNMASRGDANLEVTIGEVNPPRSGTIYFAACVLELDENWWHEVVGSVEKTRRGYTIRTAGKTEWVLDVVDFLEDSILVPILVALLSSLATTYVLLKNGWIVRSAE